LKTIQIYTSQSASFKRSIAANLEHDKRTLLDAIAAEDDEELQR
jgi:hypothetical protein